MAIDNGNTLSISDKEVLESKNFLEYIGKVQKINEYRQYLKLELITEIKPQITDLELAQITKEFEFVKNKYRAHNILIKVQQKILNYNISKAQQSH